MKFTKIFFWVAILLFLGSLIFTIVPTHKASAATIKLSAKAVKDGTFSWIDAAHIQATFGNTSLIFFDRDIGDNIYEYEVLGYQCPGKIFANNPKSSDPGHAVLDLDIIPPDTQGVDCQNTPENKMDVDIGGAGNDILYSLSKDKKTIKRVDGNGWTFIQSTNASTPNLYLRKDDSSTCKDRMLVSGQGGLATFYNLVAGGSISDPILADQLSLRGISCHVDDSQSDSGWVMVKSGESFPLFEISDSTSTPPGTGNNNEDSSGSTSEPTCESEGGALGWLLCPVTRIIDSGLNWVDTQVQALLEVDESAYSGNTLKQSWGQIRNIAYIVLVPIMLIMVIGTALNLNFLDAYTIKRAMPRMVIAVIFITLSWEITTLLIQISNVVGAGVMGIITNPFKAKGIDTLTLSTLFEPPSGVVGQGFGVLMGIATFASFSIGVIVMLWLFGPVLLLTIGIAFIVLLLRQLLVIALVLVAPLAILAWIFPNNEKSWKLWWSTFSKLLLMFPLIMTCLAVGRVFAVIIKEGGIGSGGVNSILAKMAMLIVWVIPYALIPLTFKFAGGVFATVTGMVNDRSKGLFDRAKQGRANKLERTSQGNAFKNAPRGSLRSRINTIGAGALNINKAGLDPRHMRSRMQSTLAKNGYNDAAELKEKNTDFGAIIGNDTFLEAGRTSRQLNADGSARDGSERAVRQYLHEHGYRGRDLDQGTADVMAAKRGSSQRAFDIAAVTALPATGTGFGGGAGEMYTAINDIAGDDRNLAARMYGEMRGTAERARRSDLIGGGFGDGRIAMETQYQAGDSATAMAASTATIDRGTRHSQDLGTILRQKPRVVERLVPQMVDDFSAAMGRRDIAGATDAAAQLAVVRGQMGALPEEVRQTVTQRLAAAGIDFGAQESVDEQFGTIIGTVSGRQAIELANEIRTKAGLYDTGSRGYPSDPSARGGAMPPPPTE